MVTILNEPKLICLHTVKWFQVLPLDTNNSIQHFSFACKQLNDSKYCDIILIIKLHKSHSLAHS